MPIFRADMHIHSLLSPCGDLTMSPENIIEKALQKGLDIIAITDHNSTLQAPLIKEIGQQRGLHVVLGCEITSKEEAHCLAYFDTEEQRVRMQKILDQHLPNIPNDPDTFGYQIVVDKDENVVFEEERWLISALDLSIDELYNIIHDIGGLFIPAHVDKKTTSITSQLGFIPPDIKADGIELTKFMTNEDFRKQHSYLNKFQLLHSSDAHYIDIIGESYTELDLPTRSFAEIKKWLG